MVVLNLAILIQGCAQFKSAWTLPDPHEEGTTSARVEDRLDELELLKRRDMVTPEEYTAKRQEILKDL